MCRNVARGVVAQMLPQTRCLNSGAVTNLEPSFQIHTSKKFTRNFRNVLPFDFVVFASSPHAPYVVFRELSLQGHDDVMMSSLNLPDKSIEKRARDFKLETRSSDKLCKRNIGQLTRILLMFEPLLTRQSLSGCLSVVTNWYSRRKRSTS